MWKKHWIALTFFLLASYTGSSRAEAVFVAAPYRTDMVYDFRRDLIYVANGNEVLRYAVATQEFLSPIPLGAGVQLKGMDISPDGSRLAIADSTGTASSVRVHVVDLRTLATAKRATTKAFGEGGTWSVAFASDGTLLVTSTFEGSGWVPMRRLLVNPGRWSTVASVRQDTMLSASADRKTIAFAEANISDGRWGLYDVPTHRVVRRDGYSNGTSWFNYEIATDAMGSQFAIPTYGGTYIYGVDYERLQIVGQYAGPQPIGAAYHPVENLLYFPWAETSTVRVIDAQTFALVDTIEIGNSFQTTGNWAYSNGRTKLSADGSLLMVTVPGGLRYVRMYAPLAAGNIAAVAGSGVSTSVPLVGTIGNNGSLAYFISQRPKHGTVTVSGATATYKSDAGYTGPDSFQYTVRYGSAASKVGVATITVE